MFFLPPEIVEIEIFLEEKGGRNFRFDKSWL